SVPPEFMQGWYRDNWFNVPDLAIRAGGSPHSPNDVRASHGAYSASGVGTIGSATAAPKNAAAGDYRSTENDEFKKHMLAIIMQRDMDMRVIVQQAEAQHIKLEAATIELVKLRAAIGEERRARDDMMAVMVAKEKLEIEERARRVEETRKADAERKRVQEECANLHAAIARLELGQQAMRDIVVKRFDEEERAKQALREEKLTMEAMEREKKEEEEKTEKKEGGEKEMANAETPSSGVHTPSGGGAPFMETPVFRGSVAARDRLLNLCFYCHEEGHHSKDCTGSPKSEEMCDLCGGRGHAASACLPSKRCYNCNKTGHRHYECKEQGTRRCFHCRKVGHLAMYCKNSPSQ
ncbi:hypothetical protein PFISCL1PPCAC_6708, partial [Pristionchus fissidentatus]